MKATVDEETCIGCTACCDTCPEVFQMVGECAAVKVEPVPPEQEECALQAAEECPVEAIKIEGY
jgi:ferredoxin